METDFDMKETVMSILNSSKFAEKRASKLGQDDFLRLLALFNEKNVHFR